MKLPAGEHTHGLWVGVVLIKLLSFAVILNLVSYAASCLLHVQDGG